MRVALFSDAVPPRLDGVAVTVARLTKELASRGHEVALIGPGPFDAVVGARVHLRLAGVALPTLPGLHGALPLLGGGARVLDRFAPDLVHVFTEMPVGFAGRQYALRRRVPLVTSAHTDYPAYVRHWGFAFAERHVLAWLRWFHAPARVTLCPSRS
jgi:glycosyltransferase involved in cell wall biosynthesis